MITANTEDAIELRVDDIAQLFHTLDPFPFRERSLDRRREDIVVRRARELATDRPSRSSFIFPDIEAETKRVARISAKHSDDISPIGRM